jgi:EamA domain-containing membrane protein RarD
MILSYETYFILKRNADYNFFKGLFMSVLALINLRLIDLIKNNNELWPELTRDWRDA